MFVILKSAAGLSYEIEGKTITLRGGCAINDIAESDVAAIRAKYASFDKMADKGYIIIKGTQNAAKKASDVAVDDVKQETYDAQEEAQEATAKRTRTKKVKAEK